MGELKLDGIDKAILRNLMRDARMPILQIAKEIGISGAAIHQRLRKLEKSKLIIGSKMIIDPRILGFTTTAFIGVYLDSAAIIPSTIKALEKIPEVLESHYTTGNWAIFAKILCRDNVHLMEVLNNKVQQIKGVTRTETFISFAQQIDRQIKI
jgi:Lrp/AsnC family transcriptional regulator for asnA, asnC and gidA